MMSELKFFWAFLMAIPLILSAQRSSEAGLVIGAANYMGDLAPAPFAANETNFALGGQYRHMFNPTMGVKGSVTFAKLTGADENIPLPVPLPGARRWEMESFLMEAAVQGEWHPMGSSRFNNAGVYERQISPYIGVGFGLAFGNAEVTVPQNDNTRFPEAGNKSAYFVFPLTFGMRFDVTESIIFTGEFSVRVTFSDYLDGVSQNGNPNTDDHYLFAGISILYLIEAEYGSSSR